jgi:predicted phage tail protein
MINVHLHGPLADKFGGLHAFDIKTPGEAVAALSANYPGFRRAFFESAEYFVIADGDVVTGELAATVPLSKEVHLVPNIEGAAFLAPVFIAVGASIGVGAVASQIIGGIIITALMVGVSMLLSPKPKKPTNEAQESARDENYMFSGPENVTEQGAAVPLVYGRCFVGSVVVSAGLSTSDQYYFGVIPTMDTMKVAGQRVVPA